MSTARIVEKVAESGSAGIDAPAAQFGAGLLAFLSFKVFLAVQLGLDGFQAMLAGLDQGSLAEMIAAHVLRLDALSLRVVQAVLTLAG